MKYIRTYEGWFSSNPKNYESSKESSRKSIKSFLKNIGYSEADNMTDEQLITQIKLFANNKDFSEQNRLAWELYKIAKPLFNF